MTRRLVWGLTALAVLATSAGAWFVATFEQVAVQRRERPAVQARRDPYLALERFLGRMGRPLIRTSDPQRLDRLGPRDVAIVASGRRYHLDAGRRDRLFAWVEAGGYLIIVPELDDETDAILAPLDLHWPDWDEAWEEDGDDAPPRPKMPPTLDVVIPEAPRPLRAAFTPGMIVGSREPAWMAGDSVYGAPFLHFPHGAGAITVVASLERIAANTAIGEHDHAELLWTLLSRYQPEGAVTLVSQLHVPTLFEWLGEHAGAPLVSLASVVALWLWHIVPRSGPLAPDAPPARRELREHLSAIGSFMWRSGALAAGERANTPHAFTAMMRARQHAARRAGRQS